MMQSGKAYGVDRDDHRASPGSFKGNLLSANYQIEGRTRGTSAEERPAVRQAETLALFDAFKPWLLDRLSKISTKSALADTLERIVTGRTKMNALHELMPWEWEASQAVHGAKAAA